MSELAANVVESERTILGTLLLYKGEAVIEARGLAPKDFYDPRHGHICAAIFALDDAQKPIDSLTVYEQLTLAGHAKSLDPLGGRAYLADLTLHIITPDAMAYHVAKLRKSARRRAWGAYAQKLAARALDPKASDDDVIDDGEGGAVRLTDDGPEEEAPRDAAPILKETVKIIEKRSDNRSTAVTGISYGIEGIDEFTAGMQGNEYILLGGRPSMGKTALAFNIVMNTLRVFVPNLVFSMEMKDTALMQRGISREARVAAGSLKSGRLDQSDWISITKAASRMSSWPLRIDRRGSLNMRDVRSTARRWHQEKRNWKCENCRRLEEKVCRHRVITLDYLQLLHPVPSDQKRYENRQRELSEISRSIKLLAKELDASIIVLSQLSRDLEQRGDKRPMMSDIRESGAIEQDADIIAFLYREWVYDHSKPFEDTELIFAKNRDGETGTVELNWDAKHQHFVGK